MDTSPKHSDWSEQLANTVRPLTTFIAMGVFGWMSINGKISTEAVMGVVSSILTFWFVQRQQTVTAAAGIAEKAVANGSNTAPKPPVTG
jgi:hypothetical protein